MKSVLVWLRKLIPKRRPVDDGRAERDAQFAANIKAAVESGKSYN